MQKQPDGTRAPTRDIPILCRDRVNYVGDAVAFVVADSRALAQDAAELIEVDYDGEDAAADTAHRARSRTRRWSGPNSAPTGPSLYADGRPGQDRRRLRQGRQASPASSSSTTGWSATTWSRARRSANGSADEDRFVLTTGSQGVHSMRDIIAGRCSASKPKKLRVITPDVGGGFGPKSFVYREYRAGAGGGEAPGPAGQMGGRPHRAFPDRRARPRQRASTAEMAMDADGRFLGAAGRPRSPISAPISRNTARSSPMSAPPCRPASTTSRRST